MRTFFILLAGLVFAGFLAAQDTAPGRLVFESRCARCHGGDGSGGEMGPSIRGRLASRSDEQLAKLIHEGSGAMPPVSVVDAEMTPLVRFLRSLQPRGREIVRVTAKLVDGKTLEGELLNQGFTDLQMRTGDGRVHLLRRAGTDRFREAVAGVDWPSYNGDPGGNRYTTLPEITKANVARMQPKWIFTLPGAGLLQGTPVVVGGIMYMPASNECYALDAGTGRLIWHYGGLQGEKTRRAPIAAWRWPAIVSSWQTDNAHIMALESLHRRARCGIREMADYKLNYFATSAPAGRRATW